MTHDQFLGQMQRIVGLRFAPPSWQTHWEGLQTMSEAELTRAVSEALTECDDFPSPATLRRLAAKTAPLIDQDEDRSAPAEHAAVFDDPRLSKPIAVTRLWKYYCDACSDTGWETRWCGEDGEARNPWIRLGQCGRDDEHAAHEWAERCACWSSNPAVLKKRERLARSAIQRTGKSA